MMNIYLYLRISCCSFLLFALISCNSKSPAASSNTLPSSFDEFYSQFHQDSLFQIQHVMFPLDGKPEMMDSMVHNFKWLKENWIMHKEISNQHDEFSQSFEIVDPTIVEEYIIHKTAGFGIFRRYGLISGEWHLIYYVGMNPPEMFK